MIRLLDISIRRMEMNIKKAIEKLDTEVMLLSDIRYVQFTTLKEILLALGEPDEKPICPHCNKSISKTRLSADVCLCAWKGIPIKDEKPSECKHAWEGKLVGCERCIWCGVKRHSDTITISRKVAEEWLQFWGGWQETIEQKSPQTKMVEELRRSLNAHEKKA
jgi:hypothetical protein